MKPKIILLEQFDGAVYFLRLDLDSGVGEIIKSTDANETDLAFGSFEFEKSSQDADVVALLATPNGPLLFLNSKKYAPVLGKTKIIIKDDENISHFLVLHESEVIFGLFYKKKFGLGLHLYNNSREDIDFYFWLSEKIKSQEFYVNFQREVNYSR